MADPALLYEITERMLDTFADKESPEITSLKGLYLLLKDEGYPVRESWWPQLPADLRNPARQFINEPITDNVSKEQINTCLEINQNLGEWLSRETDLIIP